ncbi:unnamed protein product [Rotaria sordida]|uniref:Nuclear receptor domain-containing protein n=1 Tax=Rotaria sordida TaxID=392033 RepID=A0A819HI17_9BILA|nr:unnamed protein product [Rotaria sordida]CAF3898829.1 unnamed protein product [Rotaria sordida]CAF4107281.1 unnamed protein product [Rotaria sordida]
MYSDQYNLSTTFDNSHMSESSFRFNDSYYLDSLPYSSYNTNSYPFRQQTTHSHLTSSSSSSNVYLSSYQHPFSSSTSQLTHTDVISYPNYDTTYLNVAVAAAYQNQYQNHNNNTVNDSIDINFSRHIGELYGNSNEQEIEINHPQQKSSISIVQSSKKRKFQDETMKSQYESELCRVCDDISSGYHFGVFTCEACKGFFRRYSKKSTILEPCPIRCCINKNNRNNCAACRFDKCKCVGMALDKIRFGKPPKIFRSSSLISSVKLEPNYNDFQLMLKLLECYQSFEEYDQQSTTNTHSSIIFQFCHRLADIVMNENERIPETFLARLKRHESTIKFLITGENDRNLSSWCKEPQAWIFAHNERWRLIMILLILAFDDEQIGGGSLIFLSSNSDTNENIFHLSNDTVIERILRLFELECDQEKEARTYTEGSNIYTHNLTNEKNIKYMKAQFVLRFIDMMANDMISNRICSSTINNDLLNSYLISEDNIYRNTNELIYLPCNDEIQIQTT